MVVLDSYDATKDLPAWLKTGACGVGAASFRVFLMPIDTLKTMAQTEGANWIPMLKQKFAAKGPSVFYHGAMGAAAANYIGYYPWFATYNQLEASLPTKDSDGNPHGTVMKLSRRAFMGFGASAVSDLISNSTRVLKVYKQTHINAEISYVACAKEVIAQDGVSGLFLRGLQTKIIANGMQGAMFSVLWKTLEPMFFGK